MWTGEEEEEEAEAGKGNTLIIWIQKQGQLFAHTKKAFGGLIMVNHLSMRLSFQMKHVGTFAYNSEFLFFIEILCNQLR